MLMQDKSNQKLDYASFFKQYPVITYGRGERITRPSELSSNVVYVKSGYLKIYHVSKSGKEIIINIINAASYNVLLFGIAPYIRKYSIEALTEVEVVRAPRDVFFTFMDRHPHGYSDLLLPLSRCLESVYSQIELLKSGDAYFKIASAIHNLGKEAGEDKKNYTVIGFRVTHQMIANLTGLTRETVTVQLNKLREKGLIGYEDNVLKINDIAKLTHLLETEG
jgi:CRP/FNR family cyclic AMP-dependent transcriptional regulator